MVFDNVHNDDWSIDSSSLGRTLALTDRSISTRLKLRLQYAYAQLAYLGTNYFVTTYALLQRPGRYEIKMISIGRLCGKR